MPGLVEIDRDAAARRIAGACSGLPAVAAAFLFGSALGLCRPDSDIDVGVIRRDLRGESADDRFRAGLGLEYELLRSLGECDGHAFDVTVLDADQPLFAMTVLTDGRLCHVGDEEAYTDFLERVARGYADCAPRYERALDEVLTDPVVPVSMNVDGSRVRQRADYVRGHIAALRSVAARTDARGFAWDTVAVAAARHLLRTSIETLIDLAYHLSAKMVHHAPKSAHDAFDTLAGVGILDEAGMSRRHEYLGLRKRVVKGSVDLDGRQIHALLLGPDLDEIAATLARFEAAARGAAAAGGARSRRPILPERPESASGSAP